MSITPDPTSTPFAATGATGAGSATPGAPGALVPGSPTGSPGVVSTMVPNAPPPPAPSDAVRTSPQELSAAARAQASLNLGPGVFARWQNVPQLLLNDALLQDSPLYRAAPTFDLENGFLASYTVDPRFPIWKDDANALAVFVCPHPAFPAQLVWALTDPTFPSFVRLHGNGSEAYSITDTDPWSEAFSVLMQLGYPESLDPGIDPCFCTGVCDGELAATLSEKAGVYGGNLFLGQQMISGQNADEATSVMTRELVDQRVSYIRLTANQALSNSVTPVITALQIPLTVGLWQIAATLVTSAASGVPGVRFKTTFSGALSASDRFCFVQSTVGGANGNVAAVALNTNYDSTSASIGYHTIISPSLIQVTAPGTLALWFSQKVADVSATTLQSYSSLVAQRLSH